MILLRQLLFNMNYDLEIDSDIVSGVVVYHLRWSGCEDAGYVMSKTNPFLVLESRRNPVHNTRVKDGIISYTQKSGCCD
jgi:hypothetical protein